MGLSITLIIIIVTCIVSISALNNGKIIDDLIFYPPAITEQKQWYRFFTCGLIHADYGHLIFNMLSLYIFGEAVEAKFMLIFGAKGKIFYLLIYILALFFCLLPTFSKHKHDYYYRSLGASGAVSAIIFAGILFYPMMGMGLFFIPIYIAAFIFGFVYLLISTWMEKSNTGNVNHSAHIYGALFGLGATIVLCYAFNYPAVQYFIEMIKNANPSNFIRFGR